MSKKLEIGDSVSRVSKVQIDGKDIACGDYVASNAINGPAPQLKTKKPIPCGSAIGGADSAFPNHNFVLGGCYQCSGDDSTDWMRPIVMGNDPATVEQSFKYSIPIRDGHGRMFTYCGTQKYHAELEYEVMNLGAVKYVIKQELAKTAVLDLVAADIGTPTGTLIPLTESGRNKVLEFFNTNGGKAIKNIRKIYVEPLNGAKMTINMFNYVEAYPGVSENLQMAVAANIETGALLTVLILPERQSTTSAVYVSDAEWAGTFATGIKFTITYTDIPE